MAEAGMETVRPEPDEPAQPAAPPVPSRPEGPPPPPAPSPSGASSPPGASCPPDTPSDLLGGRSAAVDATLPPVAFVGGWLLTGHSIAAGTIAALVTGAAVAIWRLHRGARPRAVLVGLLMVGVAAVIVLRTGRAADFFLV